MKETHVVIVGAGFGGLTAAKALGRNRELRITLIDRRNHYLFQPLLYQVATAGLSPADIASPIRAILSHYKNITVKLESVTRVDLEKKEVVLGDQTRVGYDFLILSCGAKHSYFRHPEWEDFAPGLKTLEQATEIRRRILLAFEKAENETDSVKQASWLTFVIVGGGPTGVELAGALSEMSQTTLLQDFRTIDPRKTRVILVEAGKTVLSTFAPSLRRRASKDLEQMGVEIRTSSRVTQVDSEGVHLGDEVISARTVLWAAGVRPSSINEILKSPLDPSGRVIIEPALHLPDYKEVFVIGDQAHFKTKEGDALPGVAPVALQQGKWAARNIQRKIKGREMLPFKYFDKGQLATIGKRKALLQFGKIRLFGTLAWYAWLFVHIFYLIGFKNRFSVMVQWAWNYFTSQKTARLIMKKDWKLHSS